MIKQFQQLTRNTLIVICLWMSQLVASQPFVIGELMGQFGNQMFIIATATALALDNEAIPLFPSLKTESDFNIPLNYEKVFANLNASKPKQPIEYCYIEQKYSFTAIPYRPNMLIRGWFQSELYFGHRYPEIADLFAPSSEVMKYLCQKYSDIIHSPNTVGIHFRSYDKEDPEQNVYIKCSLEYYKGAISQFPADTIFIVFSNEIDWCKEKFAEIPRNFIFIEGETHFHDFYLMSLCKHNIICNSSFSWWAAYLNSNPKKIIIAPFNWFNPSYGADPKDLIPKSWMQLNHSGEWVKSD